MSTLGHVLFLLPFSRDFVPSACIASFLNKAQFSPARSTVGETSRRELHMRGHTLIKGHTLSKGHTLGKGHTLKGHTLKGHTLKGHTLKGHTL
jgi:hypothetical protein